MDTSKGVAVITVRDTDVHHWFWRLRALGRECPDLPQAALADVLASSLRRECVGLYVGRADVTLPEDLARAVLDCLDALARRAEPNLAADVAADAETLSAALAVA